ASGASQNLDTWKALGELYYNVKGFTILAGFEFLSGNKTNLTGNTSYAFNPFYGTNHKFNGFMDYLYVGRYMNRCGLWDTYFTFSYTTEK
ncbi:MAG: hypothetical protein ACRCR9_02470, partial [Chitinophagaceae bacterium]